MVPFQNIELDFQLNMNLDQSSSTQCHVILIISTWKNDFFWTKPMKSPLKMFVLYFTMTEVGKMNLVWVGSIDIYFVNVGSSQSHHIKKIHSN